MSKLVSPSLTYNWLQYSPYSRMGAMLAARIPSPTHANTLNLPLHKLRLSLVTRSFLHSAGGALMNRPKVVVLGSGWGAFKFLQDIGKGYDVTVVSPRNHFVLTPLLASVSVGTLGPRSVIEPVRSLGKNHTFFQATCIDVDSKNRKVICQNAFDPTEEPFELPYDKLVMSVGAVSGTFGIDRVPENCHFLKEAQDALGIRHHIVKLCEEASEPTMSHEKRKKLLSFVIVGGGPTGIEFSAELNDFMERDLFKLYPNLKEHVSITVVSAGQILDMFNSKLQEYTSKRFARKKIVVKQGAIVKECHPGKFILTDGSEVPYGFALWSAGIAPQPLLSKLPFAKNKQGRLLTDPFLSIPEAPDIYAYGDCATIEENDLPCTAQVAAQKGKYLAKVFNEMYKDHTDTAFGPFSYTHRGSMAYVGGYKALVDHPLHKQSGFWAFFMWRSFYLTTAVSLKNKCLIPMYWFLTLVFGRDTSVIKTTQSGPAGW
eukprot:Nk52_evm3s211 gene=Nk52_evmTU3s211